MCNSLRVRWNIVPQTAPRPWIACSGCGGPRAFESSGKIRLNANGRRLDAWLIYKCLTCDKTWNRPIFERQNVRDIDPAVLDALQSNDPQWIRAEAFNLAALQRKSQRVETFSEVDIEKEILHEPSHWTTLAIALTVPFPVGMRLDRLLASALAVSRARLQALHALGLLRTNSDRADILRRPVKTGVEVAIDLASEADREHHWRSSATGHGP
ncbi:MAG: DUF1062 domain-containing protein [Rhizobiales bacterium]|nr:DUF1062 domain-containing protein [Hyphomicrobiales bacterium]